ncbi:OLC1v1021754C1 [Oldenlandia corymbosa var. corymbosa]|uniref:OLC1v1021754C1 n=1 Tax=Oldenlandia corymbosa var. corymbosa TaxID=529605 RepID=A0AAV1BWJ7_OLDCO|nr:OLC1v1021754C1 [Oldenlandia corymbosa var. corymbosa]
MNALAYATPSTKIATHFYHFPKLSSRKGHPSSYLLNQQKLSVLACSSSSSDSGGGGEKKSEKRSFLSLEEAGLVEISGLSTHERFLCRLTISSLNLLRVISEQEGCSIEELNAGKICDWFLKDKLKREQNLGSAVLQWDDPDFGF